MSNSKLPWYKEGLQFSCTQCGKCCTGAPGRVIVSKQEIVEMSKFLNLSVNDFKRLYVKRSGQEYLLVELKSKNHSCVFFEDQKCRVYTKRPKQCKTYPFWQENLNSPESWALAAKDCEGISEKGDLVSLQEIEGQLN